MTPKEQYEYRKAVRKEQREAGKGCRRLSDENEDVTDMLDRFVTAVERIADVLEAQRMEAD